MEPFLFLKGRKEEIKHENQGEEIEKKKSKEEWVNETTLELYSHPILW
jgi:hypothetical protein